MGTDANERLELAVGARIAAITGGCVSLHDDGSADSLHDLDLKLPEGRRAAIEVTGVVDGQALGSLSASSRLGYHVDGMTGFWDVDLVDFPLTKRKPLHTKIPQLLLEYESLGKQVVAAADDQRLADLGVRCVTNHGSGSSFVLSGVGGGSMGPSDVVQPVERVAGRQDNVDKLRRSNADERHVAVWVDVTATVAYAALNDFAPAALPTEPPSLPTEIDTLWVLRLNSSEGGIDFDVVWRWTPVDGWSDVSNDSGVESVGTEADTWGSR